MSAYSLAILLAYLMAFSALMVSRYVNRKVGHVGALLASLITFTIAVLRPADFPDYVEYVDIFDKSASGEFESPAYWISHSEPGFKIISFVLSSMGWNYIGLLGLMAALSFLLLIVISRIIKINFAFLWFAYFSFFFIIRDLVQIRLAIACHLIIIALISRNMITRSFCSIVAPLAFQYYSIIPIILINTFSTLRPRIILFSAIFGLSFVLAVAINFNDWVVVIPNKQIDTYFGSDSISPGYLEAILPALRNMLLAALLYWVILGENELKVRASWVWMAFFSVIFYISLSGIIVAAQRFAAYFGSIFPVAFAFYMNKLEIGKLKFGLLVLICALNFSAGFYSNNFVWMP